MNNNIQHLFTSESVFPGHPDKIADQISDAILDACLEQDSKARVACETMCSPNKVVLAGEITTTAKIDYEAIVQQTVKKIGYIYKDLGFSYDDLIVENNIHTQSPDISQGVDVGGAGDNGLIFGGACNQTKDLMPLPIALSKKLEYNFRRYCKNNLDFAKNFRPDGKTQVSINYIDDQTKCVCVVFNVQTTEECEQSGQYRQMITDFVIVPTLEEFNLNTDCKIYINPTGKFVVGGPFGDSGLTGRKIIVCTYGGYYRHGGGAQSGKDPTKVDKSAIMMTRYIAKNIVKAGICDNVEIQLAYAIGVVQPVSISFFNSGLSQNELVALEKAVRKLFDCSVNGIKNTFNLCQPISIRKFRYEDCAAYGYVGNSVFEETGIQLPWEKTDIAETLLNEYRKILLDMQIKVYINITNSCNYSCPFCCMWSSPQKTTFMQFNTFKMIVDRHCHESDDLIVQLEGGEPTIHPQFPLFLNYLSSLKNVTKIVVDTNGSTINELIGQINWIAMHYEKDIDVKLSDNSYIRKLKPITPILYKNLITACEFVEHVGIYVNLRAHTEDELNELYKSYVNEIPQEDDKDLHVRDFSKFVSKFTFNRYGKAGNDDRLVVPYITRQWNSFYLYDSNGRCHDEDLISRSDAEKKYV